MNSPESPESSPHGHPAPSVVGAQAPHRPTHHSLVTGRRLACQGWATWSKPSGETVHTRASLRAEGRAEGQAQSPAQEVDSEPIWVLEGRQAPEG